VLHGPKGRRPQLRDRLGLFRLREDEADLPSRRHRSSPARRRQAAEQELVGERLADRVLDEARHRASAICGSKPFRARNSLSFGVNVGSTFFSCSLRLELEQELVGRPSG
jgi:transposase InsO family protein